MHKEVIKTTISKEITKDYLQQRVDKLVEYGTLLNKPNKSKDSFRIKIDIINYPNIKNISSVFVH